VRFPELLTPAERRLAVLLFILAAIGALGRGGRSLSPEVAAWMDRLEDPIEAERSPGGDAAGPPRASAPPPPAPPSAPVSPEGDAPDHPGARVDPNRADAQTLCTLPGIGPALAARILADRETNGPYRGPEDLLRVRGIGPSTLARIRPLLAFR
jgi:competence protein ComEA